MTEEIETVIDKGKKLLDAAYGRDYVGMRAALESGDDTTIHSEDSVGNTALHYAVFAKAETCGQYCQFNPQVPDNRENRDKSAQEMVKFLLEWEAKKIVLGSGQLVKKVNTDGWAPLDYCTEFNMMSTAKTLIEHGAEINTTPTTPAHHGHTPLIGASMHGNFEMVKFLLDAGANFTLYEKARCWTALNLACRQSQTDVVKIILERAPDEIIAGFFNTKDEDGEYPLTYAVANGLKEIIPDMLSHGASLYKMNGDKLEMHDIDTESFRRFLDDQISVEMLKRNGKDVAFTVADTEIKLKYTKLQRSQVDLEDDAFTKNENENGHLLKPSNDNGNTHKVLLVDFNDSNNEDITDKGVVGRKENLHFLQHDHTAIQVMDDMVKISPSHKELLKHPVCMALLMRKWRQLEFLYYGWIYVKVNFLFLLITIAFMEGPLLKESLKKLRQNTTIIHENKTNENTSEFQTSALIMLLIIMIIVELSQMTVSLKWWALQVKNWCQLLILVLCSIVVFDLLKKDQNTAELDLHLLGLLIPMVFYEILHEVGYHPTMAKYILLLDKVCITFLWYGVIYAGLVITPAISFYLMTGQNERVYPTEFPELLTKTFVMFVGEVELFDVSETVAYKWIEIGFFLTFIFFLAVVLMNLLNALAIVDTKELMDDAEIEKLSSLLETVSFWETNKRFTLSFLSMSSGNISSLVPNSVLVEDTEDEKNNKIITIRPYDKSDKDKKWQMSNRFLVFFRIIQMLQCKKYDRCKAVGPFETYNLFGKMGKAIVLGALDIVNRREERKRKIQNKEKETGRRNMKEKETEEWNKDIGKKIKEDSDKMDQLEELNKNMSEQIKLQEEWNTNMSEQIKRQEEREKNMSEQIKRQEERVVKISQQISSLMKLIEDNYTT